MKRRAVLLAGAGLAGAGLRAFSQSQKLRRVVFLHPGSEAGFGAWVGMFRSTMKELGYAEGRNIALEVLWLNDRTERLPVAVAEVVAHRPDAIVTISSAAIAEFKKATTTIPIVFASAADPVEQGFVASLSRPGGNITGVIVYSALTQKLVEVTREALPAARTLGLLLHDADPFHKTVLKDFEPSARRLKFEPVVVRVSGADDFDRAFGELAKRKADAVLSPSLALFTSHRARLAEGAVKARLPLISTNPLLAETGALMAYGTTTAENYRRAAVLVDKILKGAKPGELPVEQPERFELIVNMKTAKLIGITPSKATLQRADRVIE